MNITITRESVGPADDILAPHKKILRNIQKRSAHSVIEEIRDNYLPQNVQGGSTWIIERGNQPIAVIAFPSREIVFLEGTEIDSESLELDKDLRATCAGSITPTSWLEENIDKSKRTEG
jgi:hypothetical protein